MSNPNGGEAMLWDSKWSKLLTTAVLAAATTTSGGVTAGQEADLLQHPMLTKYPSPEEIVKQYSELKASQPGAVEDILADFDLAIRSSLTLKHPVPGGAAPITGWPEATTGYTLRPDSAAKMIQRYKEIDELDQALFYERNFSDLVVEDHPQLGLVMMYVAVQPWEDWSAWDPQNEKLKKARNKFPQLHRMHALAILGTLQYTPAIGLIARVSIDKDDPLNEGRLWTDWMGNYEDGLRFYIDWALDPGTSIDRRSSLWSAIDTMAQRMRAQTTGQERSRAFWGPYLNSDVPTLWYCAQKAWDRQIQEDLNWLSNAQGDWNYEHEPNPDIRELLGRKRDLAQRIAEIQAREDPQTNRLMPEDAAALQELHAERKALEAEYKQLTEGSEKETSEQPLPDSPE